MPLTLSLVTGEDLQVLENLLQLYLHEASRFDPVEIGEDGKFDTSPFTKLLLTPEVDAYLVRIKGKIAGFAIVKPTFQGGEIVARSLTDLFLLETYRGFGIGEEVARMVFDQSPGLWHLEIYGKHEEAAKFWAKVIYRYTGDDFRHLTRRGNRSEIFEFRSPAARPQYSGPANEPEAIISPLPQET
ncbi:MAG: hypothetical protein JNM28_05315 [Armatimonadetes bacterium]|nr:hypothetical protein [Armatimonadota bacterium]MBS1712404.1 hypothetical protein [Armatimonadota bacterium]MBX3109287.1 hypothetical protein [Fimbriimonadaceae bacterium]